MLNQIYGMIWNLLYFIEWLGWVLETRTLSPTGMHRDSRVRIYLWFNRLFIHFPAIMTAFNMFLFVFTDACMLSPPRAPLQVVNGPNPNGPNPSTPSNNISVSGQKYSDDMSASPLCRLGSTPALERLLKKISKRNSKGETPLHTAAIRGSPRLGKKFQSLNHWVRWKAP